MNLPSYFEPVWLSFTFAFGACIGSFLNVVIYRLPHGMSVAMPPSHCPACQHQIAWYDNIPCLSYLVLRGQCRNCGVSFSLRYWTLEFACGLIGLSIWLSIANGIQPELIFQHTLEWLFWQGFVFSLVALSIIDFQYLIIPDEVTLFLLILGLGGLGLFSAEIAIEHLLGGIAGAGFLLLIAAVGFLIYRREAMGMGDVKLLGAIGLFLGWRVLPLILFLSAVQAIAVVGVVTLLTKVFKIESSFVRTTSEVDEHFGETEKYEDFNGPDRLAIPFGPFLALSAVESFFLGDEFFWKIIDLIVPTATL